MYSAFAFGLPHQWIRAVGIGPRAQALAVGHEDPSAGRIRTLVGYQPTGTKPSERLSAAVGNVDHGQVVGVGIGHPQRLAVGRQGQAVGRGAVRGLGIERGRDDLDRPPGLGVDHADRVAVGAGHVEQVLFGREGHFRRMRGRGPGGLDLLRGAIDHRHRRLAPEADVQPIGASPTAGRHRDGCRRHGDRLLFLRVLKRHGHHQVAQAAGRVEPLAVAAARQPGGHLGRSRAWEARLLPGSSVVPSAKWKR